MTPKVAEFLNLGMRRDVADSKVGNEHVYENYNVRIDNNDGDTVYSATNERGNLNKGLEIPGTILGVCELLDGAVIFSKDENDIITYILREGDNYSIEKQYIGNLNFNTGGFFDSIVDYETDSVTKVYWVDGVNQPRVITLQEDWDEYDDTSFDFVPEIDKFPHVYIEKEHTSGVGIFKAGIVQYFFTYSNIHGVETAVVYSSPLFYADHKKRAGKPGDFVECQFNISISNLSEKFDKINVYRAIRTSIDTEVEMVKIANIDITGDSTQIIDDYVGGQAVSPTDIFFKGGDRFVAGTLASKDNTLFLGNISTDVPTYEELQDILQYVNTVGFADNFVSAKNLEYIPSNAFLNGNREVTYTQGTSNGNVFHSSNSYLKKGDYYNIGVQLQDKFGKWSEPIVIDEFLSPTGVPAGGNIPKQLLRINTAAIDPSIKEKYKNIRAVACFPEEHKRNFIAQGVLNPTLYCTKDRQDNLPYAMTSWFFRSIPDRNSANVDGSESTGLEYRHDRILPYNNKLNCEAQFMDPLGITESGNNGDRFITAITTRLNYVTSEISDRMRRSSLFAIDSSICTLNSPDITDVGTDQEECDVSIVGYFNTQKTVAEYKILMASSSNTFIESPSNITPERKISSLRKYPLSTWPLYFDSFASIFADIEGSGKGQAMKLLSENSGVAWAVYPWQADRPLGNDFLWSTDWQDWDEDNFFNALSHTGSNVNVRGLYNKKVLGNIRHCESGVYFSSSKKISDVSEINYYRGTNSNLIRFNSTIGDSSNGNLNFYTGLDEIFTGYITNDEILYDDKYYNSSFDSFDGRDRIYSNAYILKYSNGKSFSQYRGRFKYDPVSYSDFLSSDTRVLFNQHSIYDGYENLSLLAFEPTLIRYKTTPHAIFRINPQYDEANNRYIDRVLPGYMDLVHPDTDEYQSMWNNTTHIEPAISDLIAFNNLDENDKYWMGELTRNTDPTLMFPSDINDRSFMPISDIYDFSFDNIRIELYGDIHYQRWDCLKTYPYSYDDKNQVIDVLSFMVESKINLDGRYDKYVETEDVTSIDDSFFNLIDDAYNQKDNLFTYHIQEDWVKENKNFPNQFAWSQTKHPGEEIDTWTSVNLASTYQVDGSLGEIRKLIKFGDMLFCFQDKGISQIMFNSNIQLSSSSGVPIELANSGKVDGVRYFTNMEGCKNPWTIKPGISGIYFVDDINHNLDRIGAQGIDRLSESKGFSDFAHNHQFKMTWIDNEKKDVHFVYDDKTIAYSEKLNEFSSFYDYGRANIAFNIGYNFNQLYGTSNILFTARKGDYFYFFDDELPSVFSVTYRMAPQPFEYKIFNTVDYLLRVSSQRGISNDLVYDTGFHEIEISTENGKIKQKIDKDDFATNMNQIKKLNIWRTNIPRFDYFRRADGTSIYLKLSAGPDEDGNAYQDDLQDKRYELHNLRLSYLS